MIQKELDITETAASKALTALIQMLPDSINASDVQRVQQAYLFAAAAHGSHRRESDELYIEHDLSVAQGMANLGVDVDTVVAALLHDILRKHTNVTEKDIRHKFGSEIAGLVSGLNNLYHYANDVDYKPSHATNGDTKKLEAIRSAILSIIEGDIRIILIQLTDCLQVMRRAHRLARARQLEVAAEAMHIYAPLANRLGVWQLKWELEDLAFRYLEPERYREIAAKLADHRAQRKAKVDRAVKRLGRKIYEAGIQGEISGRPKHIYSIYRKMVQKQLDFEHIYDIQALRVVLDLTFSEENAPKNNKEYEEAERALCYQVLGIVHSLWQPIPREFDDYIASPKSNGYKSLHTAVIDPETGETLEVQIRTRRMHEEAERGVAAHWAYKESGSRVSASAQKRIQNLRELLSSLRDSGGDDEQDDNLESEFLADRIYVFTPKGDVVDLPAGATPIDYAYQIHTSIGHRCRGARVNGKMVSLDYELQSGERVEILTYSEISKAGPSRDWMNPSLGYTKSARTRSKIRQWFRNQEREQNIQQGRDVVERELKRLGVQEAYTVAKIAEQLKFSDVDEFLAKVGFGDIHSSQISGAIARLQDNLKPDDELRPLLMRQSPAKSKGLRVKGVSGVHTRMAKCCNPIPPEPIIGFVTRGQGVTIHRQGCSQVDAITDRDRLIDVSWGEESETYPIPIVVRAFRRSKLVDDILNILRGQQIDVPKTKTITQDNIVSIYLIAEVNTLEQLNYLLKKLENLPNVLEATRQRWS